MKMCKEVRTELKLIAEELGGEYQELLCVDHTGKSSRKVVITYPEDK